MSWPFRLVKIRAISIRPALLREVDLADGKIETRTRTYAGMLAAWATLDRTYALRTGLSARGHHQLEKVSPNQRAFGSTSPPVNRWFSQP